jgi:cell division protein FtsB
MEKVNLEFLARQLDRLINEVADLKDEVAVLLAKVERLEATSNILAAEARAMQNR